MCNHGHRCSRSQCSGDVLLLFALPLCYFGLSVMSQGSLIYQQPTADWLLPLRMVLNSDFQGKRVDIKQYEILFTNVLKLKLWAPSFSCFKIHSYNIIVIKQQINFNYCEFMMYSRACAIYFLIFLHLSKIENPKVSHASTVDHLWID